MFFFVSMVLLSYALVFAVTLIHHIDQFHSTFERQLALFLRGGQTFNWWGHNSF